MSSTFAGLEIGSRGLSAHQKALDITSHNLANASTPGYSRQRPEITATYPFTYPGLNRAYTSGQMGTGVDVTAVTRVRDLLIDDQIQQESSTSGYWESRRDILDQAELIVNEPADSNIRTSVDQFWQSLQTLSERPNEPGVRSDFRQQAIGLTDSIRENNQQLNALRYDVNQRILGKVLDINNYADQIAELNDQIGKITALGDRPNDLLDKRDQLVEKLGKTINIKCFTDDLNRVTITVKGIPLVDGQISNKILIKDNPNDQGMAQLLWSEPKDRPVDVTNGELAGLTVMRDQYLPKMINDLNSFSSTLITTLNALHSTGYGLKGSTGIKLFSGTNAMDIMVSDAITNETSGLNKIAASSNWDTTAVGNGEVALKMAQVKQEKLLMSNTATMGEFIGSMVADLGSCTSIAKIKADHQAVLINNLDNRRESICGVSMDEEMTNMVKFQHGYNAAAKIISTMDEMLDVVINRLKV
jgi:flagellar hook-associated protein 1